jgi:hypothetical protein
MCEDKGCCWSPAKNIKDNYPWCFNKGEKNVCQPLILNANNPGFDNNFYMGM